MNDNFPIFLVDVFAEQRYSGNPLAVVICAQPLADARMQSIAAEMNFSETTFVAAQANAGGEYSTRIFTPVREIAFTGHPILGTGWVVRSHYIEYLRPAFLGEELSLLTWVDDVKRRARARGMAMLKLAVLEANPRAQKFWRREGFTHHRDAPATPESDGHDRVVLKCRL